MTREVPVFVIPGVRKALERMEGEGGCCSRTFASFRLERRAGGASGARGRGGGSQIKGEPPESKRRVLTIGFLGGRCLSFFPLFVTACHCLVTGLVLLCNL